MSCWKMPLGAAGGGETTAEPHQEGAFAGSPSGVALHMVHLLPGSHLGAKGPFGAVISVCHSVGHHRPC